MLSVQRRQFILQNLESLGSVRTAVLAQDLGVTDETIRKDLEQLAEEGSLIKVHGGACRKGGRLIREAPLNERLKLHQAEKEAIARLAVSRIQPNETVFMDASSTVLTMAQFLPDFPVTILTNALSIVDALEVGEGYRLICTGGRYDRRSRSFVGFPAEQSLRRHNIHRMFFSGHGFDLDRGVSEVDVDQATFKERVISYSEEICCLADHTKLGVKSTYFFASCDTVTVLISDSKADPEFVSQLEGKTREISLAS